MKELNWNIFAAKFNGKENSAFERMAYGLFCSKFNQPHGIFAFKNQAGTETEPIQVNNEIIGFQAKYFEPSVTLSSRKNLMIKSIEKAVKNNTSIDRLLFYINKPFGQSKNPNQNFPKYIYEIQAKAKKLNVIIDWQVPSQIEKQLSLSINSDISQEFFPDFYEFGRQKLLLNNQNELLSITKTAIIQLEIEKFKEFYANSSWDLRNKEISKLYRFVDHTNETVASSIIYFLQDISNQTRANMPSSIAANLFSLVLSFFPSSYDSEEDARLENGLQCVHIGFDLVYDSLILLGNYRIAQYGLNIWKYLYRESKRSNQPELSETILERYSELENTLLRPERSDLSDSRLLVKIFKEDLETYSLAFPVVPDRLYKIIRLCD